MDSDTLTDSLQVLAWATLLSLFFQFLFWRFGFYTRAFNWKEGDSPINLMQTALILFSYLFVQLFLMPLLAYLLLSYQLGMFVETPLDYVEPIEESWTLFAIMVVASLTVLIIPLFFEKRVRNYVWNASFKSVKERINSFLFGLLTWVLAFPLVLVVSQLTELLIYYIWGEIPEGLEQKAVKFLKDIQEFPELFYPSALAVAFLVPMAEELLFRGFLQNSLKSMISLPWAIGVTSFIFSLMHYNGEQGVLNIQLLPLLFILSCYLGWIYEREGTLWAPIGLHTAFNSVTLLLL